ncbi:hypothetical protein [Bacteroides ovatus]|nr:hypothetical protein [Bacteroides ovatus]CAG9886084.1 Rossmann fold nucleotide-binding protein Smf possibly involved in DNA uptake [Bacteroides ovatus]
MKKGRQDRIAETLTINAILFELEMKGVVRVLAGGMYQLLN